MKLKDEYAFWGVVGGEMRRSSRSKSFDDDNEKGCERHASAHIFQPLLPIKEVETFEREEA